MAKAISKANTSKKKAVSVRNVERVGQQKAESKTTKPNQLKAPSPNYKRHYRGKPEKINNEREDFPMRLNRFLALRGIATRRDADDMIRRGQVMLNGKVALLGDKVTHPDENIEIYQEGFREQKALEYVAYYKERGIISHSPKGNEKDIKSTSPYPHLFPLGRLDKDSEGLILLTNDGRVTERLLHPRFEHEKEYIVSVTPRVTAKVKDTLLRGVLHTGERLSARKVTILDPQTLAVVLTEGKKHQVRRMLEMCDLTVTRLVRVRIMNIHLGSLKPGEARELRGPARKSFLKSLDLA